MFGSDQPLNLVRARSFINPSRGQRLITDYNYHWVDKEEHAEFKHLATNLIHSHWGSVNALKKVIDEYPVKDQDKIKDMVFFTNAKLFYKFN